jgi:hypothetical protein
MHFINNIEHFVLSKQIEIHICWHGVFLINVVLQNNLYSQSLKSNALQTLIWHSCVMHLLTFNFSANDMLFLCICKVAFFTLLIHQESMEKTNHSTLHAQDKTSFTTHHLKNKSKLWLHTYLISHSFHFQRHCNCSTQFHKCWLAAPSLCEFMNKYSCKCSDTSSREYHFCRKYKNLKEVGRDIEVL